MRQGGFKRGRSSPTPRYALSPLDTIEDTDSLLLGAFGSGATFGMGDGWLLAQALEYE